MKNVFCILVGILGVTSMVFGNDDCPYGMGGKLGLKTVNRSVFENGGTREIDTQEINVNGVAVYDQISETEGSITLNYRAHETFSQS